MKKFRLIATTTFGLESSVKREVTKLGFENMRTYDGRVEFDGDYSTIAKANLWLRYASKVLILFGQFRATTFTELFDGTKALPWGELIPADGKFTVIGKSVKSTLFSVPDCQSIVKKAIVEKLKEKYHLSWFDETGPQYTIQIALLNDIAMLTIDTTGSALHQRGYRENSLAAPLKETLAAAMIELSYWKKDRILLDPLCGSGTIPIEAALIARNIAPGLNRKFVSEQWPTFEKSIWKQERIDAYQAIDYECTPQIFGSDVDAQAIEIARQNAEKAGVDDCITFQVKPFQEIVLPGDYGCMITNPPYGERIGQLKEVENLYRQLGALMRKNPTWSSYVITSMEYFESLFGKKADAKRKLFNGRIKIDYYQFYGPRPPKKTQMEEV